jgi:hypothetical protein
MPGVRTRSVVRTDAPGDGYGFNWRCRASRVGACGWPRDVRGLRELQGPDDLVREVRRRAVPSGSSRAMPSTALLCPIARWRQTMARSPKLQAVFDRTPQRALGSWPRASVLWSPTRAAASPDLGVPPVFAIHREGASPSTGSSTWPPRRRCASSSSAAWPRPTSSCSISTSSPSSIPPARAPCAPPGDGRPYNGAGPRSGPTRWL